jgi:hypothetical protein
MLENSHEAADLEEQRPNLQLAHCVEGRNCSSPFCPRLDEGTDLDFGYALYSRDNVRLKQEKVDARVQVCTKSAVPTIEKVTCFGSGGIDKALFR